ncbi:MAG: filamentous hemagglutinin N-terminal domain-containing protein [Akkermansiaceae bacterium]|nr:filamentous hemagglutinin N-terminal domain-containing protein [Akkermansiaceae bacterium]MCP5551777.1 filamentous hemagglutinin N-terminal domain-containing protein [Akkermansiaceae bacterium]
MNLFREPNRRSLAWLLCAALIPGLSLRANPLGEAVRHGDVQFERLDGQLRVLQHTDKAIIDWESFSIGAGELTEFLQPGARSAALNRVRGASASQIDGALRANGRVYLINPNGVMIGPGGTIDVAGFTASTLDVSDGEFLAGGDLNFRGPSQAGIVNLGRITAFDGDVFLVAATVENAGTISAPNGTVGLAAGNDVLITESGAERVFVRGASGGKKSAGVTNKGTIEANIAELKAHGGNIYAMAINNEGRVAATGVTREGGQIFLRAGGGGTTVRSTGTLKARRADGSGGRIEVDSGPGGKTEIGGEVDASGDTGTGGEILILGDEIDLFSGSLIIADGPTGGGSIFVGGGAGGADETLRNARRVTVGEGARLSANALNAGDGGRIVIFAEGDTTFLGTLSATGGPNGGNGGFAEISGKQSVTIPNLSRQIDLSAVSGAFGTLLIDPVNGAVVDGGLGGSTGNTFTDADIAAFLQSSGNFILETDLAGPDPGDITIAGGVDITWNSANSLTFNAFRDFTMVGSIIASQGTGSVRVDAGRAISLGSSAVISTMDGMVRLGANQGAPQSGNFVGIAVDNAQILSTGAGDITLLGRGGDAGGGNTGIRISGGSQVAASAGGKVTMTGTGGPGSGIANHGIHIVGGSSVSGVDGDLLFTGQGNSDGTAGDSVGVYFQDGGTASTTGTGAININGMGGPGVTNNPGVAFFHSTATATGISTVNGEIHIVGQGGGTGGFNDGIRLENAMSFVRSTGTGNVTFEGTAGAGSPNSAGIALRTGASYGAASHTGTTTFLADTVELGALATITLAGPATASLQSAGDLTIAPLTAMTSMGAGGGATGTLNLTAAELGFLVDGFNSITLGSSTTGTATLGSATYLDPLHVIGNSIVIDGAVSGGDNDLTFDATRNLAANTGASVATTSGNIVLNANQGAPQSGNFIGIALNNATIGSTSGTISLTGTGGDAGDGNTGIRLAGSTAQISSASGNITLTGHGGASTGNFNVGIRVLGDAKILSTGMGAGAATITLNGTGGSDGGSSNTGIYLSGFSTDVKAIDGAIDINGWGGGDGSGSFNHGVLLENLVATIESTGVGSAIGAITIDGTGGNGVGNNIGVVFSGDVSLKTVDADLTVTGTGGSGSGDSNQGIRMDSGAVIESTGTGTEAGTISLIGTGGTGANSNHGIHAHGFGTRIESVDGKISLDGQGGMATADNNFGVFLGNSSTIRSTGTGANAAAIDIKGVGGTGTSLNKGIEFNGLVESIDGDIKIDGTGGGTGPMSEKNRGIEGTGSTSRSTGAGNVTLIGQGGAGDNENDGIQLNGNSVVEVANGALSMTGTAGGTLGMGVFVNSDSESSGSRLTSTGTGSVTVTGTGAGMMAPGVLLDTNANTIGGANAAFATVRSLGGDTILNSPTEANGDVTVEGPEKVVLDGAILSNMGNVSVTGNRIDVNAPVSAAAATGSISLSIDDNGAANDGTIAVNALLTEGGGGLAFNGGAGTADTVTYAGFGGGPIVFDFNDLAGIEILTGPLTPGDELLGPAAASAYDFTGPDSFTVGGVAVTEFENVTAGSNDDTFSFTGGTASLSGHLDGGGGANQLDYSGFPTGVVVNLATGTATAIGGGFSNITGFTGSPVVDTLTGPAAASIFNITGPDTFDVGGVFFINQFENLIGGGEDDVFKFFPGGSLSGFIDGGLAATKNRLDYSGFNAPVTINLGTTPSASATAVGGGFGNVTDFIGSTGATDLFRGPNAGSTYNLTALDAFNTGPFSAKDFENLTGGNAADTFKVSPGAGLTGILTGGGGPDTLDYSGHGASAMVDLGAGQATGFGGFASIEKFIGSGAADTLQATSSADVFNITADNAGNVGGTTFMAFDILRGAGGNDRFNFLNQATLALVDGGPGTDTLFLNDSNLGGTNTYTISANSISRNPTYTFNSVEVIQLLLGPGDDTVNTQAFGGFTQILDGGPGSDTLNVPGLFVDQGSPFGPISFINFNQPTSNGVDLGDILQIQIDQPLLDLNIIGDAGFSTQNNFNILGGGMNVLSGGLTSLQGAFAAAAAAGQAVIISVDGNPVIAFTPFSLDGSGLTPSNLAVAALAESLGVNANLELAQAIGYDGAIFLFMPDGAHALDLSGAPADPNVVNALRESLAIAAAQELAAALGLNIQIVITPVDAPLAMDLSGAAAGQAILLELADQLGDGAFNELNAAIGGSAN